MARILPVIADVGDEVQIHWRTKDGKEFLQRITVPEQSAKPVFRATKEESKK